MIRRQPSETFILVAVRKSSFREVLPPISAAKHFCEKLFQASPAHAFFVLSLGLKHLIIRKQHVIMLAKVCPIVTHLP